MKPEASGPVAVIFDNFGPYHRARLNGAAKAMALCGIELSGRSTEYSWNATAHDADWTHYSVVPEGSCRAIPTADLSARLGRLLDEIQPAAVAVPGWAQASSQLTTQWCVNNGVPAILMSESCAHDEARRPVQEAVKTKLVALHSAALVGGTAHVEYLKQLGMPTDRIFTGYDAIDNDYFAEKSDDARRDADTLRKRFGLPERYFLASARFIAKKNLLRLIEAYAGYRSAQMTGSTAAPWSLVLLGDGILAPQIRERIQALGITGHVLLPGFQQYPELPAYYGLAGAFIHASTTEQWGLVVNEAMASGLPVLVSERCGCACDLVREADNGFRFHPEDTAAISRLLTQIASDSTDRVRMGEAGRRIAREFGPGKFGQGLLQAVNRAHEIKPLRSGMISRTLLRGLIYSQSRSSAQVSK